MNLKNIKIICFDFDGTIANTMPVLESNAVSLFIKFHPDLKSELATENYRKTTGLPFEQQVELIFPNDSTNKSLIEEFERLKLETIFNQNLFPESIEVLRILKHRQFVIAISSSTYKEIIDDYVEKKNIAAYIDIILGYRPGFEKGKDHFDYLIQYYKVDSASILYIGDSLKDMERAFNSKVNFIGRTSIMNDSSAFRILDVNNSQIKFNSISNLKELLKYLI